MDIISLYVNCIDSSGFFFLMADFLTDFYIKSVKNRLLHYHGKVVRYCSYNSDIFRAFL